MQFVISVGGNPWGVICESKKRVLTQTSQGRFQVIYLELGRMQLPENLYFPVKADRQSHYYAVRVLKRYLK